MKGILLLFCAVLVGCATPSSVVSSVDLERATLEAFASRPKPDLKDCPQFAELPSDADVFELIRKYNEALQTGGECKSKQKELAEWIARLYEEIDRRLKEIEQKK